MNFSYSREIPRRKINENQTRERARTRFMKIVRCMVWYGMVCYSVKMWHRHAESACRMCRLCALNKGTNRRSDVKELTEQKIILLIYYHNNFHREIFSMCIYKYLNIYIVSCYCLNWEFSVVFLVPRRHRHMFAPQTTQHTSQAGERSFQLVCSCLYHPKTMKRKKKKMLTRAYKAEKTYIHQILRTKSK